MHPGLPAGCLSDFLDLTTYRQGATNEMASLPPDDELHTFRLFLWPT